MIETAYTLLAMVILCMSLCTINRMGGRTRLFLRLAYISLAIGGLAGIVMLLDGHQPTMADLLLLFGMATKLAVDRRARARESWSTLAVPTQLGH